MYAPAAFDETRLDVLHALIRAHPLGALVTQGADGLCADHLPFEIGAPSEAAPYGTLRCHVARANPLWRAGSHQGQAMVLFQGPQAYVSPNWYEEKARSGQVVPTYNYAVVQVHGALKVVEDADWLLALLGRLTAHHEAQQASPWRVDDAPRDYVDKLLKAIVGIEIPITRLQGKWKTSQNRSTEDQRRVANGLRGDGAQAGAMADLMQARLAGQA